MLVILFFLCCVLALYFGLVLGLFVEEAAPTRCARWGCLVYKKRQCGRLKRRAAHCPLGCDNLVVPLLAPAGGVWRKACVLFVPLLAPAGGYW